jgi:hypothetical protein
MRHSHQASGDAFQIGLKSPVSITIWNAGMLRPMVVKFRARELMNLRLDGSSGNALCFAFAD